MMLIKNSIIGEGIGDVKIMTMLTPAGIWIDGEVGSGITEINIGGLPYGSFGIIYGPCAPGEDRAAILAALESVNGVIIFDELLATSFLRTAMPDVYVKGGDYTVDDLPAEERAVVNELGGRVVVLGHVPGKSSSNLAQRIMEG